MNALVHLFDSNGLQVNTEVENGQLVLWLRDGETTVSVTCTQATARRIAQALSALPGAMFGEQTDDTEAAHEHTITITNTIDPDAMARAISRGMAEVADKINKAAEVARECQQAAELRRRAEADEWLKISEEQDDAPEKPDTISAKQQLIHLIERVVPDDASMCSATFSFRGYWNGMDYGPFALGNAISEVEVEPNNMDMFRGEREDDYRGYRVNAGAPRINITTNELYGRSS